MHPKRSPLFTRIETLEPRIAPAGIIDIVTTDGSAVLKVFGNTDTAQDLTIAGSLNGTLFIFGNDNETFRLNGIVGNGPIVLPGIVGNLSIDLGKNNDTLQVTGVFLGVAGRGVFYGPVTLNLGGGIDILTVGAGNADNQIYAYRAFKVFGGAGEVLSLLNGNTFLVDPVIS